MKCFLCYRQRGFKKIFLLHEGVKIALAGEFSLNSKTIVNHELLGTNEDSLGSKPVGKVCKKVEH
jgi:hypothetical protein